jgi:hypothetical protein
MRGGAVVDHLKKVLIVLAASVIVIVLTKNAQADPFPLVYHSCQGEGCGCAASPVVQADTIVKKPGRAKITEVMKSQDIDLKVGDEIQLILNKGEGTWLVWRKQKELELNKSEDASWKTLEPPITESWFKLGNAGIEGYTQDFPFQGCLE